MKGRMWPLYVGFLIVAVLIYFGTSVISTKQETLEKSRVLVKQTKSVQLLMRDAHRSLNAQERSKIDELNVILDQVKSEEERLGILEQLAGAWYRLSNYEVSGHYAEQIAEIRQSAEAWSIAGTTYAQGISMNNEERDRLYCAEKSRAAFDQSKLILPENQDVDLNLALTYVNLPDESNPMAGIQMLLKLKSQYPEYAPVYRHLGRLGIQTGQFEKAISRLQTAWSLERDEGKVSCLLSQAFQELGKVDSAQYYSQLCKH